MISPSSICSHRAGIQHLILETLHSLVADFASNCDICVMQFGHFMLLHAPRTGQIIPGIAPEMKAHGFPEELCDSIGMFPIITWSLGIRMLPTLPVRAAYGLILVNDWQYLKGMADLRTQYYSDHQSIPDSFSTVCIERAVEIPRLLFPPSQNVTGCYFSEVELRNRFKKHVAKRHVIINSDEVESVVAATGVYCGRPNCTAEVAQLVADAASAGNPGKTVAFVNIYPLGCREHVRKGTALAYKLFDLSNIIVLNLGLPSAISDETELLQHIDIEFVDAHCDIEFP